MKYYAVNIRVEMPAENQEQFVKDITHTLHHDFVRFVNAYGLEARVLASPAEEIPPLSTKDGGEWNGHMVVKAKCCHCLHEVVFKDDGSCPVCNRKGCDV